MLEEEISGRCSGRWDCTAAVVLTAAAVVLAVVVSQFRSFDLVDP